MITGPDVETDQSPPVLPNVPERERPRACWAPDSHEGKNPSMTRLLTTRRTAASAHGRAWLAVRLAGYPRPACLGAPLYWPCGATPAAQPAHRVGPVRHRQPGARRLRAWWRRCSAGDTDLDRDHEYAGAVP